MERIETELESIGWTVWHNAGLYIPRRVSSGPLHLGDWPYYAYPTLREAVTAGRCYAQE